MNQMTEYNVENRTIFCDDNLHMLTGIDSECVDLLYLDPPFNKKNLRLQAEPVLKEPVPQIFSGKNT